MFITNIGQKNTNKPKPNQNNHLDTDVFIKGQKSREKEENPVELGRVKWIFSKDFKDVAQHNAQKYNRPLLFLFTSIPGSFRGKQYGQKVLNDQAIVEKIHKNFIPVAINNNLDGGEDAVICQFLKEPTNPDPVIRIMDYKLNDIVPRQKGEYTPHLLQRYMQKALFQFKWKRVEIPSLPKKKVPKKYLLFSQYLPINKKRKSYYNI